MATVAQLIAQLRYDLEDPELPGEANDPTNPDSDSLWTNAELLRYLDDAQRQFCTLVDALPDMFSFTSRVSATQPWVERDPLIKRIRHGYLTTAQREIQPISLVELQRGFVDDDYGHRSINNWRTSTGTPSYVATDLDNLNWRLIPEPVADDTIEWSVYRLPLDGITNTSSEIEIDERWHYDLLSWAKYMAFSKQDAETQDATRQAAALNDWNVRVIPEARTFYRMRYRKAGTTGYGGI